MRSDQGAQATLDEFFRLCDAGGSTCAFAPHSEDRFQALAELLRDHPVRVVFPDGGEERVIYQDLVVNTQFAMYDSVSWPDLAQVLADIEAQVSPRQLGRSLAALQAATGLGRDTPRYRNFAEGQPGVLCADSINPTSYDAWSKQGAIADERFGYFGRWWTWLSSVCSQWPGADQDRYLGPFDATTSEPLLVIGNLYDPATSYQGAQIVHRLMPTSSLLTLRGWGHTSLFLSGCVDRIAVRYLKTLGHSRTRDDLRYRRGAVPAAARRRGPHAENAADPDPRPGRLDALNERSRHQSRPATDRAASSGSPSNRRAPRRRASAGVIHPPTERGTIAASDRSSGA